MNYTGQLNKVEDLANMDLVAFHGGVNAFENAFVKGGFKHGAEYYRQIVRDLGMFGFSRVADLGAGYGRWSAFLAEVNYHVSGFERYNEGVKLAGNLMDHFELSNTDFIAADITSLPVKDESFDAAWCYNTLHMSDRHKILTEAHRILAPGGVLCIGAYHGVGKVVQKLLKGYAADGLDSRITQFCLQCLRRGALSDEGQGNFITESDLDEVLNRFGFELDSDHNMIINKDPARAAGINLELDLSDTAAFADRFESDPDYAASLSANIKIAQRLTQSFTFRAVRR